MATVVVVEAATVVKLGIEMLAGGECASYSVRQRTNSTHLSTLILPQTTTLNLLSISPPLSAAHSFALTRLNWVIEREREREKKKKKKIGQWRKESS